MGWITTFNNVFIHVLMYYYFAMQVSFTVQFLLIFVQLMITCSIESWLQYLVEKIFDNCSNRSIWNRYQHFLVLYLFLLQWHPLSWNTRCMAVSQFCWIFILCLIYEFLSADLHDIKEHKGSNKGRLRKDINKDSRNNFMWSVTINLSLHFSE